MEISSGHGRRRSRQSIYPVSGSRSRAVSSSPCAEIAVVGFSGRMEWGWVFVHIFRELEVVILRIAI